LILSKNLLSDFIRSITRLLPKLTAEGRIPPKYFPISSHVHLEYFFDKYIAASRLSLPLCPLTHNTSLWIPYAPRTASLISSIFGHEDNRGTAPIIWFYLPSTNLPDLLDSGVLRFLKILPFFKGDFLSYPMPNLIEKHSN